MSESKPSSTRLSRDDRRDGDPHGDDRVTPLADADHAETCPATSDFGEKGHRPELGGTGSAEIDMHALWGRFASTADEPLGESAVPTPPSSQHRYGIIERLGQGGMGVVYRVRDHFLGRELAMKLIRSKQPEKQGELPRPEDLTRFIREAEITAKLDHPGVVPIHDFGLDSRGRIFFTMRLVRGERLDVVFQLARASRENWTPTRVLHSILNICETMAFAHSRGIIHRDLKPQNIMVGQFGETYVMDWGLAKFIQGKPDSPSDASNTPSTLSAMAPDDDEPRDNSKTRAGAVLGTSNYMPPEQASGNTALVDQRADIYAAGAILYELLAGSRPYAEVDSAQMPLPVVAGPPVAILTLNPKVPAELVSICEKAMARRPQDRYRSMLEMAEDLRAYLEHRVVRAYQTGAWAELRKWVKRNRGLAAGGMLAGFITVAGLLALVDIQSRANSRLEKANSQIGSANIRIRKETDLKQQALDKEKSARTIAEAERKRVEGLLLAHRASDVVSSNPERAMLLAKEAHQLYPGFAANSALLNAFEHFHPARTFFGHRGRVRTIAVHPDGNRLLTSSDDATSMIWDIKTATPKHVLIGHTDWVREAWFSPDGRRIVTVSNDHTAMVWDAELGERLHVLEGHEGFVLSAAFSPDSKTIATTSVDATTRLWETGSGRELFVLRGHEHLVFKSAFNPDGTRLITGSADETARIWDTATGTELKKLTGHTGGVGVVQFSPGGRFALTTAARNRHTLAADGQQRTPRSTDTFGRVWNVEDGTLKWELKHRAPVLSASFNVAGDRIITGAIDGLVVVWDATTGAAVLEKQLVDRVTEVAFASDGRNWAAGTDNGSVWVWSQDTRQAELLAGHSDSIFGLGFGPANEIVTASADGTAKVWRSRAAGRVEAQIIEERKPRTVISPDSNRILLAFLPTQTLQLIQGSDGGKVAELEHDSLVADFKFNSGSSRIAAHTSTGAIYVWSSLNGRLIHRVDQTGTVQFDFANDDLLVALSADDHVVNVWDLSADAPRRVLQIPDRQTMRSRTGDPRIVVWNNESAAAEVWDVVQGNKIGSIPLQSSSQDHSHVMLLAPDGKSAIVSSVDGPVSQLWNLPDCHLIDTLHGVRSIGESRHVFSADGSRWITGSESGDLRVLDARTGKTVTNLTMTESPIAYVAANHNGSRLVTRTTDRVARLWDTDTGRSMVVLSDRNDVIGFVGNSMLAAINENGRELVVWNVDRGERMSRVQARSPFLTLNVAPNGKWLTTTSADNAVRVWPVNSVEYAAALLTRDMTPDEREAFEVGTPAACADYRAKWERQLLVNWLTAAAETPVGSDTQAAVIRSHTRQAIVRFVDQLKHHLTDLEIVEQLLSLEKELRPASGTSGVHWCAFADLLDKYGKPDVAETMWRSAIDLDPAPDRSVVVRWAACAMGKLGRSPRDILARFPDRKSAELDDLEWLLGQLASGEPIFINAGGGDSRSTDGRSWRHDCFYLGGHALESPIETPLEIANTGDDSLYRTERWFDASRPTEPRGYEIPLPPGAYRIVLHFAEIVFQAPERRVFDVLAENTLVLDDFDNLAAGFATAVQKEFSVRVDDGVLNLEFRGVHQNPKVSAIEIHRDVAR